MRKVSPGSSVICSHFVQTPYPGEMRLAPDCAWYKASADVIEAPRVSANDPGMVECVLIMWIYCIVVRVFAGDV